MRRQNEQPQEEREGERDARKTPSLTDITEPVFPQLLTDVSFHSPIASHAIFREGLQRKNILGSCIYENIFLSERRLKLAQVW